MDEMKIVILGKTGVGKSSVANTILGENVFQISRSVISGTRECRSVTRRVDGRDVTLIDTPGLFDRGRPEEKMKAEIVKCIIECSPGPHAFIIVFKVERFTDQEQEVITIINQYFSEEAFKYATLLFTHGDQLKEGQTTEHYFHNNPLVTDLMEKCGGRCHVVDNKYWKNEQPDEIRSNQFQVKQLLETIHHMVEANKGSCYTNEMLQAAEKLRKEEEEKIRQSPGNMTEGEIRVSGRLLINVTGILTGAMLAAFCGGVLVVGEALKVLNESLLQEEVKKVLVLTASVVLRAPARTKVAWRAAGSLMLAAALAASVKGGFLGYDAAEEADTAGEAAKRAANAVFNKILLFLNITENQQRSNPNKNL